MLARAGMFPDLHEAEVDLTGFIFEKLQPEEPLAVSPITQREQAHAAKVAQSQDFLRMPLKDKLAWLHKTLYDPQGNSLRNIEYDEDPETGGMVRKGELGHDTPDPFDITAGIAMFAEFYTPAK